MRESADQNVNSNSTFLSEKVDAHDLILVTVTSSPGPQKLSAKIERIYSARKGIAHDSLGQEIEFIHSPGHFGDVTLKVGDRAVVFVSSISGRLYEDSWRGHMVVEEIEGILYAIFQHKELWNEESIPVAIRQFSRQDPKRPYASAIRFDVMEEYLLKLLASVPD